MPHFKLVDVNLVETGHTVDMYRLVRRLETVNGTVLQASDEKSRPVAIKVIDKSKVSTPGELEGIYREFRFLSEIIKHPNVTSCVNMLHSMTRVYLIFEYAGNHNIAELLSQRPGQRLEEEEALQCFEQLARGLAYCHSKDVSHRNLSLEHVVLAPLTGSDGYYCRLVDFHSAMVARGQTTSRTVCGTLPCIAPEMALGGPYIPRLADCWSAGIVLLEMGGGLSSLCRSVGYDPPSEAADVAPAIQRYFTVQGSHAKALDTIGAIKNKDIIGKLEAVLQPQAADRLAMASVIEQDPSAPAA
jgi:serine/threonine protein kinase